MIMLQVDLIEKWEKRNYNIKRSGGVEDKMKGLAETDLLRDTKDELEKLLETGTSDLLYEGDGDWNGVFLGHEYTSHVTTVNTDDESDYLNVPKYVNELTGGQGYDESKVDKSMFEDIGIKGKEVYEQIKNAYGMKEVGQTGDNEGDDNLDPDDWLQDITRSVDDDDGGGESDVVFDEDDYHNDDEEADDDDDDDDDDDESPPDFIQEIIE